MSARSERLRARAKQMRATAELAKEPAKKANLLKFADDWEAMAVRDEAREQAREQAARKPKPGPRN